MASVVNTKNIPPEVGQLYSFNKGYYLKRALTHKTEALEYKNKHNKKYSYDHNEEYAI